MAGLVVRLEILIRPSLWPFLLAWLTERTGSLLVVVANHEWLDLAVDSGAICCGPPWDRFPYGVRLF